MRDIMDKKGSDNQANLRAEAIRMKKQGKSKADIKKALKKLKKKSDAYKGLIPKTGKKLWGATKAGVRARVIYSGGRESEIKELLDHWGLEPMKPQKKGK